MNQTIDRQFQTPGYVVNYMASMIPPGTKTILEPSKGLGNILRRLIDYDVTAPDDFFLMDYDQRFDCVVMNPPFSTNTGILENAPKDVDLKGMKLGYYFLDRCLEMSDNVIALMPWFTLTDSDVRLRKYKNYGLISVTGLPRKTFQYTRIQTCVMQLQKGYEGSTEFRVFDLL